MAVNVSKTKFIIVHTRGKAINHNLKLRNDDNESGQNDPNLIKEIDLMYSNHADKHLRAYKLLGIYLDEYFTFDNHTHYLRAKLNRPLYCINRAKNLLTKQVLKSFYYALIHSHLSYCTIITSCSTTQNINKLAQIQKSY
jgi:hypothetical protein